MAHTHVEQEPITGGDSGIGRAVAVLFAREDADVAINYLEEEQVDAEETQRAVEAEADSSYITGIILPVLGGETIGG